MRFDLPTMEEIRGSEARVAAGAPMQLPVDDIDEDPRQPRTEFDQASLAELATTIAGRGVRQPVSVRRHPERPGRWMLNFGARRLRAAKLAGEPTIAAFEDAAADSYDQVIENEQREGLKPLEIALFVKRELDLGRSQSDIARRLGKSRAYVTLVCAMIDPPEWLMSVYRSGRCRGITELYELRRLYETDPAGVEAVLGGEGRIGRIQIELAKSRGAVASSNELSFSRVPAPAVAADSPPSGALRSPLRDTSVRRPRDPAVEPDPSRRPRLAARLDGRVVDVVLDAAPGEPGQVYAEPASGPGRISVAIDRLADLALTVS